MATRQPPGWGRTRAENVDEDEQPGQSGGQEGAEPAAEDHQAEETVRKRRVMPKLSASELFEGFVKLNQRLPLKEIRREVTAEKKLAAVVQVLQEMSQEVFPAKTFPNIVGRMQDLATKPVLQNSVARLKRGEKYANYTTVLEQEQQALEERRREQRESKRRREQEEADDLALLQEEQARRAEDREFVPRGEAGAVPADAEEVLLPDEP